jgi:prolyl-tRNA synthetase
MRPAEIGEVKKLLGALPGSLGAVGRGELFVIADEALRDRKDMVTGANEDGFHLRGVDVDRDIDVKGWLDLREVKDGEGCPQCQKPLSVYKTIEVAHIFKLGTKYSEAMGAKVQNESGESVYLVMGSYGIGLERNLAAVVEANHDENGICWPMNIAPYEVCVTVVKPKDVACHEAGERLYQDLSQAGLDVILDDRDERPGVKFKDAELIGFPYRVTIGPKGLEQGVFELVRRSDGEKTELKIEHAVETIVETVLDERS